MSEYFLLYLVLGAAAGFFAGLFGIGGGIILVPFLSWIYSRQGISSSLVMLLAIATSLATIIFTAISSVNAHHKHGAIKWDIVLRLAPGILAGSLIGTVIAQQLDTRSLKTIFGLFLILVS
ncbi:MAG: TSUP family transporter, partial [Methylococcales bacterium]